MNVGVPKETAPGERRVALVPEAAKRLVAAGIDVTVEAGAGAAASHLDAAYTDVGAALGDPWSADVVAAVRRPDADRLRDGLVPLVTGLAAERREEQKGRYEERAGADGGSLGRV